MGLVQDRAFVDRATEIPALRDMIRDALVEALFTRNDRVLPPGIVGALARHPSVTVRVKSDTEVQKLVRVANGQESTLSLGLPAEDYHYVRRQLAILKDRDIPVTVRPTVTTTHPWIVPPQGGIEVDPGDLASIDIPERGNRALVGVGARWKALYDAAARSGRMPPFFPLLPLDYAIGDALYGDAVFQSYRAPFRRYLFGVRSIASHGRRARIGFDEVPNHGTAYDLLGVMGNSLEEFVVPLAASVALAPRPRAMRNVAYHYPDAGKLGEALGKLVASGRPLVYGNVYDAAGWALVHGGAGGPFVLEAGIGGAPGVVAAREKGIDALLAGFTQKAEAPSPYDGDAKAYARTAERVGRAVCPGYASAPVRALGDLAGKLRGVGEASTAKTSLVGAVRDSGTVSLAPLFESPKEPGKVYPISRRVWESVRGVPGATYLSRLAQVWADDREYRKRFAILRQLKDEIDSARILQPALGGG